MLNMQPSKRQAEYLTYLVGLGGIDPLAEQLGRLLDGYVRRDWVKLSARMPGDQPWRYAQITPAGCAAIGRGMGEVAARAQEISARVREATERNQTVRAVG